MAGDKYLQVGSSTDFQEKQAVQTSAGAGDAGKIPALNSSGLIDTSMLPSLAASYTVNSITTNTSAVIGHAYLADMNGAAGSITLTLPDAALYSGQAILAAISTFNSGRHLTIATTSSQTINGASAGSYPTLNKVSSGAVFVSDGTNWFTQPMEVDLTKDVTGVLPNANGGTGLDTSGATNGQILIGNGSGGFTLAAITAGSSKISVTNGSGSIALDVNQANLALGSIGGSLDLSTQVTGNLAQLKGWQTQTATATENIALGALVNFYNSSGLKVRNADNTNGRAADGFAPAAVSNTASGTFIVGDGPNTNGAGFVVDGTPATSLTVGSVYYLDAAGGLTATLPTTSGYVVQKVGKAVSTTELQVKLGLTTTRA